MTDDTATKIYWGGFDGTHFLTNCAGYKYSLCCMHPVGYTRIMYVYKSLSRRNIWIFWYMIVLHAECKHETENWIINPYLFTFNYLFFIFRFFNIFIYIFFIIIRWLYLYIYSPKEYIYTWIHITIYVTDTGRIN